MALNKNDWHDAIKTKQGSLQFISLEKLAAAYPKIKKLPFSIRILLERNKECNELLKWAQNAFENFTVEPPRMGICPQVNLE